MSDLPRGVAGMGRLTLRPSQPGMGEIAQGVASDPNRSRTVEIQPPPPIAPGAARPMSDRIRHLWEILRAEGLPAVGGELRCFLRRRIQAVIAWRRRTHTVDLDGIHVRCEI
ncbi:MAG: hypothetical protein RMK32_02635 [Anaerolineae bacterium]|nr:hypothetical protein [Anaerolineae bacterium]